MGKIIKAGIILLEKHSTMVENMISAYVFEIWYAYLIIMHKDSKIYVAGHT
ncbi:MAG: hypothetical protein E3K37_10625 [Candidatus Kuenenia sp.]|nr:hypothetical protein [Candidatus Kuenenia hertensis]